MPARAAGWLPAVPLVEGRGPVRAERTVLVTDERRVREEVLQLRREGFADREIATRLGVDEDVVAAVDDATSDRPSPSPVDPSEVKRKPG
jgi:hypothetical protein